MGVGGAAVSSAQRPVLDPQAALFAPSPPPPQKRARLPSPPSAAVHVPHPVQLIPVSKLKSACRGCGECGRGGGAAAGGCSCGGEILTKPSISTQLWGSSGISQLQLILVFSALLLTASFLLSTRAIDLSAVDLIAAAAAAGAAGDGAGGSGEYGVVSGIEDPSRFLFVENVGLGGGSWLLGGPEEHGAIVGGGRGGDGAEGRRGRARIRERVGAGGGSAVAKVTRALVRGRDTEMAAMMAALGASASEDMLVGGDMDEKELRQRIRLVEDEWDYFQEAPYRLIDEFWRDVFEAAYDDLVTRDPTVHAAAVEEIARLSGKFYDLVTIGSKVIFVPKGAGPAAVQAAAEAAADAAAMAPAQAEDEPGEPAALAVQEQVQGAAERAAERPGEDNVSTEPLQPQKVDAERTQNGTYEERTSGVAVPSQATPASVSSELWNSTEEQQQQLVKQGEGGGGGGGGVLLSGRQEGGFELAQDLRDGRGEGKDERAQQQLLLLKAREGKDEDRRAEEGREEERQEWKQGQAGQRVEGTRGEEEGAQRVDVGELGAEPAAAGAAAAGVAAVPGVLAEEGVVVSRRREVSSGNSHTALPKRKRMKGSKGKRGGEAAAAAAAAAKEEKRERRLKRKQKKEKKSKRSKRIGSSSTAA